MDGGTGFIYCRCVCSVSFSARTAKLLRLVQCMDEMEIGFCGACDRWVRAWDAEKGEIRLHRFNKSGIR